MDRASPDLGKGNSIDTLQHLSGLAVAVYVMITEHKDRVEEE